jgi:cellulose synthase/poly-beta-1,6-N-acetylglucosamine synthase-like glycosyltransferase
MNVLIAVGVILFCLYGAIMLIYKYWFIKLNQYEPLNLVPPSTSFSIIIPARNEAKNIGILLDSIIAQDYPKSLWEVIVIDDFSTDDTASIIQKYAQEYSNIQLVELAVLLNGQQLNSYKKKAIETGVALAKNEWILTTDADCIAGKDWLNMFNQYIQEKQPVLVGAPVAFTNDGSWLQTFQCLDFMALQGITAAAVSAGVHAMANGANLAYKKSVFLAVDGFKNIDNIASGDDMLLMNKIKNAYPSQMGYLYHPKAIIRTAPMDTLNGFIQQRIRWASKTNKYKDVSVIVVLWIVLLFNFYLVLMPFLGLLFGKIFYWWLVIIVLKTWIEASFAIHIAAFFSIKLSWKNLLLQFPHILYTAFAGTFGMFGKYQWKDRKVQ